MMSIDPVAIDWLGRGWLLLLAFSAAVLLVAALRPPCRRWFGTERAFQLWLLPPLAMLASQLPHPASTPMGALPSLVYVIASAAAALPAHAVAATALDWRAVAMLLWLVGSIAALLLAAAAQVHYRRRLIGATPMLDVAMRWPVLRASGVDVGPALVGAWRARIVLPADFDSRYDATERALILAHEATHARRRDGWWCLCAQIIGAVFWFHPLAWWALAALRHDQELACDAAVLREHRGQRRRYANAMLKTQSAAFPLPVGCPWSPRHPITERIAMLKLPSPSRLRRSLGTSTGIVLCFIVAGAMYVASAAPAPGPTASKSADDEYQLDIMAQRMDDTARRSHSQKITAGICMQAGKEGSVLVHDFGVRAKVMPQAGERVDIEVSATGAGNASLARVHMRGVLGQPIHAEGKSADGKQHYVFDITPLAGCPSRTATGPARARLKLITRTVADVPARGVAESVAAEAGLVLPNANALDNRLVSLNYEQIPAERAMQLVAEIDGKKAVFDGVRVHFEAK
jgi:beta-lactamase regulating signal transducer with metallopeptidase domain